MKFGLCYLVVLDNGTPFKGVFFAICKALNLHYDILTKCDHKGLSVKNSIAYIIKQQNCNGG